VENVGEHLLQPAHGQAEEENRVFGDADACVPPQQIELLPAVCPGHYFSSLIHPDIVQLLHLFVVLAEQINFKKL